MKIGNLKDGFKIFVVIIKNLCILIVAFLLAYFVSSYLASFYEPTGLFAVYEGAAMFIVTFASFFALFLPLLFIVFGDKYKYWWTGILLLPVFIFFFQADISLIYFPVIFGLVGCAIGYGLSRLLPKRAGKQN